MNNPKLEREQLVEEVEGSLDRVIAQIERLEGLKMRFAHLWPSDLDLELERKRVARLQSRLQPAAELSDSELSQIVSLLDSTSKKLSRKYFEMLRAEEIDRYRYN